MRSSGTKKEVGKLSAKELKKQLDFAGIQVVPGLHQRYGKQQMLVEHFMEVYGDVNEAWRVSENALMSIPTCAEQSREKVAEENIEWAYKALVQGSVERRQQWEMKEGKKELREHRVSSAHAKRRVEESWADIKKMGKEKEMQEAIQKEWQSWIDCDAAVLVDVKEVPEGKKAMRSRVAKTFKKETVEGRDTGNTKCKARLCLLGFEDPRIGHIQTESPTISRTGLRVCLQILANKGWKALSGDVRTAFLQGMELEEPVYAMVNEDLKLPKGKAIKVLKGVYGLVDAPRLWCKKVVQDMKALGAKQSELDPAMFTWHKPSGEVSGIVVWHVDDTVMGGDADWTKKVLPRMKDIYPWGSWEEGKFKFCGLEVEQAPKGIRLGQEDYVDKMKLIDLNEARRALVTDDPAKPLDQRTLNPKGVTVYKATAAAAQWLAGQTRTDLAGEVSLVQQEGSTPTYGALLKLNAIGKKAEQTRSQGVWIMAMPEEDMVMICFADSAWANAKGDRSQLGHVIVCTTKNMLQNMETPVSILDYRAKCSPRVTRSTMTAETYASQDGVDSLIWVQAMYTMACDAKCRVADFLEDVESGEGEEKHFAKNRPGPEMVVMTDCKSLFDAVHKEGSGGSGAGEKRVRMAIISLKEDMKDAKLTMRWTPTQLMIADALTKFGVDPGELRATMNGKWKWALKETLETKCAKKGGVSMEQSVMGSMDDDHVRESCQSARSWCLLSVGCDDVRVGERTLTTVPVRKLYPYGPSDNWESKMMRYHRRIKKDDDDDDDDRRGKGLERKKVGVNDRIFVQHQ